jgi:signal transduction histidine kinase
MLSPKWFDPPRNLLILFLATALLLVGALLWLGWQLARQDRELADKRLQERQETAADLCVAALQQALAQTEARLASLSTLASGELKNETTAYSRTLPEDSALVLRRGDKIEIYPEKRLLFYPDEPATPQFSESLFAEAGDLEMRKLDYPAALAVLKPLARSATPAIRAEALLRIARIRRQQKAWDSALAVYQELSALGNTQVTAGPAELVACQARMRVLEAASRPEAAKQEAAALLDGLHQRRWRLARGSYEFYAGEALSVLGRTGENADDPGAVALAGAVAAVCESWRTDEVHPGRRIVREDAADLLVLQHGPPQNSAALVLGPKWLEAQFSGSLDSALASMGVAIGLTDPEGRMIMGLATAAASRGAVRLALATLLPWNLHAISTKGPEAQASEWARQKMLITGLAAITVLFLAGIWLIGRAVTRELAVGRLQSDFVSAVSHEFRTPLSSICLLTELLEAGRVAGDVDRTAYYGVLARDSRRLRRLVDGLLNFGRMEAGAMQYRFDTIDPAELVREVAREFQHCSDGAGCEIEVNIHDDAPLLHADRAALDCVIWNLLDNAVKYSPECPTVGIDVERQNGWAAIRVRDRGRGIAPAEQQRIFEKFVRGEGAKQSGTPGTGIGLALVRHIVAAHQGEIHLQSTPDKGSTFTVLLPSHNSKHGENSRPLESSEQSRARKQAGT